MYNTHIFPCVLVYALACGLYPHPKPQHIHTRMHATCSTTINRIPPTGRHPSGPEVLAAGRGRPLSRRAAAAFAGTTFSPSKPTTHTCKYARAHLCACNNTRLQPLRPPPPPFIPQDTKRLLQAEAAHLHAELQRRDAAARFCADTARAEELASAGDLGRLQEQLASTEVKLDRAKQVKMLFEAAVGVDFVRWRLGSFCLRWQALCV